jgi:ornithine--oxo-acid transaminase
MVIQPTDDGRTAWEFCVSLKEKGLLAKPTHGDIIRFAPPLVITEEEIYWALDKIKEVINEFEAVPVS